MSPTVNTEGFPMATKDFKAGDKVSWNSTQGKVTGTVKKKLTAPTDIKTHHVAASPDDPQWLVESDGSGKEAAHKPEALKRVKAK
jgi:plastocyanin